mgnify:FL=1
MEASKNTKALKALKEVIAELNNIVETISEENINLIKQNNIVEKENNILKEKLKNVSEIISV